MVGARASIGRPCEGGGSRGRAGVCRPARERAGEDSHADCDGLPAFQPADESARVRSPWSCGGVPGIVGRRGRRALRDSGISGSCTGPIRRSPCARVRESRRRVWPGLGGRCRRRGLVQSCPASWRCRAPARRLSWSYPRCRGTGLASPVAKSHPAHLVECDQDEGIAARPQGGRPARRLALAWHVAAEHHRPW